MSDAPMRRRRWLWPRFSLRTLLVIMTMIGVGLGYLGIIWQRVERQRQIVERIEAAGGKVFYEHDARSLAQPVFDSPSADEQIWSSSKTADDRQILTLKTAGGERTFVEQPPGPWLLRRLMGDDIFAEVHWVDFARFLESQSSREFDPQLFSELPRLKLIELSNEQVNDEWLSLVAKVPRLQSLSLVGGMESTATVRGVATLRQARNLGALSTLGEWLDDDAVRPIADFKQLTSLALCNARNISSSVFSSVGSLHEVRDLTINSAKKVTDEGSDHLGKLRKLRSLDLMETSITGAALAHLEGLGELHTLLLSRTLIGDEGLGSLSLLPRLQRLDLTGTNVGDAGARSLSAQKTVRYLRIGRTKVTDEGLAALGQMAQLEELHLFPLETSDSGLTHLQELRNLKKMIIGPHISKKAANDLRRALPNCKILRLDAKGSGSSMEGPDDPDTEAQEHSISAP